MNRIERLMWEEAQLSAIGCPKRESQGATGARVLAVVLLVGAIALLATRVPLPPIAGAFERVPVAASTPATGAGPSAAAASGGTTGSAANAAPQDEPPIATF